MTKQLYNKRQLHDIVYRYDEYRRWLDSGAAESKAELQEWEDKYAEARTQLKAYVALPNSEQRSWVKKFMALSEWKCKCPPCDDDDCADECDCDPYQEREEMLAGFDDLIFFLS